MNDRENELARASAENGTFDAERAKKMAADAVSHFQWRLKKVERTTLLTLLICTALMALAGVQLWFTASIKAMIAFALVFLCAFETTILIKLWYWIVNGKLAVLKELKQMQLRGTVSSDVAGSFTALDKREAETSWRYPGLSRWERTAWFTAIGIVGAVAGYYIAAHESIAYVTVSESVVLKSDGGATETTEQSYQASSPISSFPMICGNLDKLASVRWIDGRGRELPYDVSPQDGQRSYTVHMIESVMPGEWMQYTQILERRSAATMQGDVWTYEGGFTYGFQHNRFAVNVQLPPGAEIVSLDPQPIERWTDKGGVRLTYQAARGSLEPFQYKIQYRLPKQDGAEKEKSPAR
jgi:hypothetical protein